jgi:hypothetical protein
MDDTDKKHIMQATDLQTVILFSFMWMIIVVLIASKRKVNHPLTVDDYRYYGQMCLGIGIILSLFGIVLPFLTMTWGNSLIGYNAEMDVPTGMPYLGLGIILVGIGVCIIVVGFILCNRILAENVRVGSKKNS